MNCTLFHLLKLVFGEFQDGAAVAMEVANECGGTGIEPTCGKFALINIPGLEGNASLWMEVGQVVIGLESSEFEPSGLFDQLSVLSELFQLKCVLVGDW